MYRQTACFILIWALSYCSELLITGNTWRRMITWPHDIIHHYLLFLRLSFYLRIWTTWECSQSARTVLQLYSDLNLQTQRTCLSLNIKNMCWSVWMMASPGTVWLDSECWVRLHNCGTLRNQCAQVQPAVSTHTHTQSSRRWQHRTPGHESFSTHTTHLF